LDSNTRGWVPFTQHTDRPDKHEHSNSFNTQEHFSQKREGKRKTRRKKKSKKFLELKRQTGWTSNGESGDRYLFMLSKLAST